MFINKIKNNILYFFKRLFNFIIALFDVLYVFIDIIITLIIFICISLVIYFIFHHILFEYFFNFTIIKILYYIYIAFRAFTFYFYAKEFLILEDNENFYFFFKILDFKIINEFLDVLFDLELNQEEILNFYFNLNDEQRTAFTNKIYNVLDYNILFDENLDSNFFKNIKILKEKIEYYNILATSVLICNYYIILFGIAVFKCALSKLGRYDYFYSLRIESGEILEEKDELMDNIRESFYFGLKLWQKTIFYKKYNSLVTYIKKSNIYIVLIKIFKATYLYEYYVCLKEIFDNKNDTCLTYFFKILIIFMFFLAFVYFAYKLKILF